MWFRVSRGLLCLYILKKRWRFGQVLIPHTQTHRQQNIGVLSLPKLLSLSWVTQWRNSVIKILFIDIITPPKQWLPLLIFTRWCWKPQKNTLIYFNIWTYSQWNENESSVQKLEQTSSFKLQIQLQKIDQNQGGRSRAKAWRAFAEKFELGQNF